MITCTKIHIEGIHIVFTLSNGHEYDPELKTVRELDWIQHMKDKNWFTVDVEAKTKRVLADYLPDEPMI